MVEAVVEATKTEVEVDITQVELLMSPPKGTLESPTLDSPTISNHFFAPGTYRTNSSTRMSSKTWRRLSISSLRLSRSLHMGLWRRNFKDLIKGRPMQ